MLNITKRTHSSRLIRRQRLPVELYSGTDTHLRLWKRYGCGALQNAGGKLEWKALSAGLPPADPAHLALPARDASGAWTAEKHFPQMTKRGVD